MQLRFTESNLSKLKQFEKAREYVRTPVHQIAKKERKTVHWHKKEYVVPFKSDSVITEVSPLYISSEEGK